MTTLKSQDVSLVDGSSALLEQNPWRHVSFMKDSKRKVRERYQRHLSPTTVTAAQERNVSCILAEGQTWRTYLPLIQELVLQQKQVKGDAAGGRNFLWILLESAAELMDHENQSHQQQTTVPNERTVLLRLVERGKIQVFCDMSVREQEHDEWEWLQYPTLTSRDRARHGLVRAARLLQQQQQQQQQREQSGLCSQVYIVVSSDDDFAKLEKVQLEEGMRLCRISDILRLLAEDLSVSADRLASWSELETSCHENFVRRNSKHPETEQESTDGDEEVELSPEQVSVGLRNKSLLRGRLQVSKENPNEAFVTIEGSGHTYFLDKGRGHFQRAFHQDMVVLQVLPKYEWGSPVGKHRLIHYKDSDNDNDDLSSNRDELSKTIPFFPTARVVSVDRPSRRSFVATLVDRPKPTDSHILVVPMDIRIPKLRVSARSWQSYVNQRLRIRVDGWEQESKYPNGRCIAVLGPIGDLETEVAALLIENQVELDPFSSAALSCLPVEGSEWTIPEKEIENRRDLRSSRQIFSVDPPGCQDIDDSMHAFALPNGDIEVGVHIADVTYFVEHNSELDREAKIRGTTFYLVDRRFDMLPSLLSSDLCSLHGNRDRLAVSVIWTLSSDLKDVKDCWFGRSVVHNCAAMTYDQADNILQDKSPDDPTLAPPPPLTAGSPVDPALVGSLKRALTVLTRLSRKLRRDREEHGGAVDLSSGDLGTELKFTLENGVPIKVAPKKDKEIHHTVAELMILSNSYVASKINDAFPQTALLRVHRSVTEDQFSDLREMLEAGGIAFDGSSNMSLAKSLRNAKRGGGGARAIVDALFQSLATRAMSEAQYVCSGDNSQQGNDFSHYGLGLDKYTHFTSPIRRYADVVVHKQLLAALADVREAMSTSSQSREREPLISLPESNVVSIMRGQGLDDADSDFGDALLDELIDGAEDLALGLVTETSDDKTIKTEEVESGRQEECDMEPYRATEVSSICDGLNLHNRLAKYSSSECQRLFLSLYLRKKSEVTEVVVVNLRSNGFWGFIPRFDLRIPVYVQDISGDVQLDPGLVGLPPDAGLPATLGFSAPRCRRFPNARCELVNDPEEQLEVEVPASTGLLVVRQLDVMTVVLTCEDWDARARVPMPRAQLVASLPMEKKENDSDERRPLITSEDLVGVGTSSPKPFAPCGDELPSLFDTIAALTIRPVIDPVSVHSRVDRSANVPSKVALGGRKVFGDFVNPDTRAAAQESAQQQASEEAARRRANALALAAKRDRYDVTKSVERASTSRQQKLAAEKRNARRAKRK